MVNPPKRSNYAHKVMWSGLISVKGDIATVFIKKCPQYQNIFKTIFIDFRRTNNCTYWGIRTQWSVAVSIFWNIGQQNEDHQVLALLSYSATRGRKSSCFQLRVDPHRHSNTGYHSGWKDHGKEVFLSVFTYVRLSSMHKQAEVSVSFTNLMAHAKVYD